MIVKVVALKLRIADALYRRTLSTDEKKAYITAVQCLTHTPAISGINGTIHRFEDHQAVHSEQTPAIHWVVGFHCIKKFQLHANFSQGHFTLWHRYFVATYEKALRDECNYTGGQP